MCRDWARVGGKHYTYVHSVDAAEMLGDDLIPLRAGSRCGWQTQRCTCGTRTTLRDAVPCSAPEITFFAAQG